MVVIAIDLIQGIHLSEPQITERHNGYVDWCEGWGSDLIANGVVCLPFPDECGEGQISTNVHWYQSQSFESQEDQAGMVGERQVNESVTGCH